MTLFNRTCIHHKNYPSMHVILSKQSLSIKLKINFNMQGESKELPKIASVQNFIK